MSDRVSLLVIAGEVSGDMHAAAVVREILHRRPDLAVFGIGGDALAEAGMEVIYPIRRMSVFGPFAALARYPFFRRVFRHLLALVEERRPAAAMLVDYGGFNLRIAAQLKKRGVPVLYYISPQVWASRRKRMYRMAASVDRLMAIFPFEPEVYAETGLRVDFVGHPLVDAARETKARPSPRLPWQGEPRVAMLPGSRDQEIDRMVPLMIETARLIEQLHPHASFIFAAPNNEAGQRVSGFFQEPMKNPARWEVIVGQTRDVLRQAMAGVVTSGTATVEAALMECPMVVVYRTSGWMYALASRIVRVPHIGMVNLIAGRELCPEFIQDAATPKAVARGLLPLLQNTPERARMVSGLRDVSTKLGEGGAAARVAAIVEETLPEAVSDAEPGGN